MSESGESRRGPDASVSWMVSLAAREALDPELCERARLSRDARFDGLFFTAVKSTGIYCRPVCPAPPPKRENIAYYAHAAAAEAAGYRPCLRCRPELSPGDGGWRRGDTVVARALAWIDEGLLSEQPLAELAARVGVGERQLRRLFVERLGAAPLAVHGTRRLLFAKQLLTETRLSILDIALAAGFQSLRRFNAAFRTAYGMAPSELRRRPPRTSDDALVLRLGYRPPYDLGAMLEFLRGRALPGVERVDDDRYARTLAPAASGLTPGWLQVRAWPGGEPALQLELHGVAAAGLLPIVARVRRMFDLDADPQAIAATLSRDHRLAPLLHARPGLRLPSGWDGFEIAVRAILGQQVSVVAARTLAARLVTRFGTPLSSPVAPGLDHLFPAPEALVDTDVGGIGVTRARANAIRGVAQALLDGRVELHLGPTLEAFVERWASLPGIGPWTAQYIAMRALGHPDAFPAEDLVLRRMASSTEVPLSTAALRKQAVAWQPWRAYAVIHLWREAGARPAPKPRPRSRVPRSPPVETPG